MEEEHHEVVDFEHFVHEDEADVNEDELDDVHADEPYDHEYSFTDMDSFYTKQIPEARSGHISACYEKFLLVWGGFNESQAHGHGYIPRNKLEMYNTETENWHSLEQKYDPPHTPPGLSGACAILMGKSLYLYAGYCSYSYTELHKLDLKTMTWQLITPNGQVPAPRDKAAGFCHEERLFFFGGFGPPIREPMGMWLYEHGTFVMDEDTLQNRESRGWNNQLLVFDPKNNTWSNPRYQGEPPSPRAAHAMTKIGDKVWLFGGRHCDTRTDELHCLDLSKKSWSGRTPPRGRWPCGRTWHSLTAISHRYLFLYGGYSQDRTPLSDAWILDTHTLLWTEIDIPDNHPRLWHTALLSNNQEVLIFGGCQGDILNHEQDCGHTNEILVYWHQPPSLLRLCIKYAEEKFRNNLPLYWDELPHNLVTLLKRRRDNYAKNCVFGKRTVLNAAVTA